MLTARIRKYFRVRQVRREISPEVYGLLNGINRRYSADWAKKAGLEKLIEIINRDPEFSRLDYLVKIGCIKSFEPRETTGLGGFGRELCFGKNGLYVYDWSDYGEGKFEETPLTVESAKRLGSGLTVRDLCQAIVEFSNRKNYIERMANMR